MLRKTIATKRATTSESLEFRFGRKIVKVETRHPPAVFTFHEDLLCSNARYFKEKLQKKRKAIEGECSICFKDMVLGALELTYCFNCGANFHFHCTEDWHQRHKNPSTCPLCRQAWKVQSDVKSIECPESDSERFGVYSKWIYTGSISLIAAEKLKDNKGNQRNDEIHKGHFDANILSLFGAYILGEKLGDDDFQDAVLEAFLECVIDFDMPIQAYTLEYLYAFLDYKGKVTKTLVDLYISKGSASWPGLDVIADYPQDFIDALIEALFKLNRATRPKTLQDLKNAVYEKGIDRGGEENEEETESRDSDSSMEE